MNTRYQIGVVVFVSTTFFCSLHSAAQVNQISFPEKLITQDDLAKDLLPGIESWSKAYDQHNEDSDEIRTLAKDFVRLTAAKAKFLTYTMPKWHSLDDPDYKRIGEIPDLAKRLIAADCKDPLVIMFAANELRLEIPADERKKLLDEAIEKLQFSKYPRGLRMFFLQRRQEVNFENNKIDKNLEREIYANIPAWIKHRTETCPTSRRATWKIITAALELHSNPQFDVLETIAEKMLDDKSLDPWLVNMFRGEVCQRRAWKGRAGALRVGNDFANDMNKASKYLRIAHNLHPDHPVAAARLISVAMSGFDDESEATWFQRAIEAQFDYEFVYDRFLWSLRPEWGGSNEEKLAFGKLCAETKQYASFIPLKYLKALQEVQSKGVDWPTLMADQEQYTLISTVLSKTLDEVEKAAAKGVHTLNKDWFDQTQLELKTHITALAFHAQDFGAAAQYWDEVGDKARSTLNYYGLDNKISRSIVAAYQEFDSELQAVPASQLAEPTMQDQAERLSKHLRSLLDKSKPQSRLALETWIRRADQSARYESGKWTDLEFRKELPQWKGSRDSIQYLDPSAVRVKFSNKTVFQTQCAGIFLGPKEISFEISDWAGIDRFGTFGLTVGNYKAVYAFHSDPSGIDQSSRYFFADLPSTVGIASFGERGPSKKIDGRIQKYHVRVWGPYYEIFVNDKFVTSGESEGFDATGPYIGFCQDAKIRVSRGEVRLANVRVRKIDFDPPEKNADPKSKVQRLTREIERYPRAHEFLYQRGQTNFSTNQLGDAITDLRRAAVIQHDNPQPHDLLAKAAAKAGLFELALNQQKVAIAQVTNNGPHKGSLLASAALNLATIPDQKLRDGKRALEMAEESIKLKPKDNPIGWLAVAAAQAELGDFAEATKAARAAKNINSQDYNNYLIGEVEKAIQSEKPYRTKVQSHHTILPEHKLAELLYPQGEFDTPIQKSKVAEQIIDSAHNTLGDDGLKRALLQRGIEFANGCGMVTTALGAIDVLQTEFDIDPKAARLESVKSSIANCPANATAKTSLVDAANGMIKTYVKQDDYDAAVDFATAFRTASAKWADKDLDTELQIQSDKLKQQQASFGVVSIAIKTLAADPSNREANGVVGKFRLFGQGDWEQALPYLAKSGDSELASAAKMELAGIVGDDKVDMAKQWDALATKATDDNERQIYLARALAWYANGACVATGTLAASADKRGAEIFQQGVTQSLVHPDRIPNTTIKPHQFTHFGNPAIRFRDARNASSSSLGVPNWIDVNKHSLSGEWKLIAGKQKKFQSPGEGQAKLLLPVVAPEQYDLDLTVKPIQDEGKAGNRTLFITLSGPGGSRFQIAFNAHDGRTHTGLERLDGLDCSENETRSFKDHFKPNEENLIMIRVRNTGLFVRVNEKKTISWQGDFSSLSTDPKWEDPRSVGLVVGTDDSQFVVSSVLLRPKAEIEILKAEFGRDKKWANITDKVREHYNRHDGGLWNDPNTLKKDPNPGWKKKSKIRFKRDGKEVTTWLNREGWFNLHKHIR